MIPSSPLTVQYEEGPIAFRKSSIVSINLDVLGLGCSSVTCLSLSCSSII